MAPKWSYSKSVNTVLPCKVVPNRVVHYFVQHDFMGKKMSVEISGINLFHILYYRHCTIGLVTSAQHRALLFLLPFLVGNIRLNWMFCLASSHSHTTKYDLHSHFTDETTAHEENRHRRWRFEGSSRLESRHGGFTPRTVSPRYYPASQGYLYPSLAYTEKSHKLEWTDFWNPGAQVNHFTPPQQWHKNILWLWSA